MQASRIGVAGLVGAGLLLSGATIGSPAGAAEVDSLREAITQGEWAVRLRPRIELVDDDATRFAGRDAEAWTLRSSFTFMSGVYRGFSFGLEVEDVTTIGTERYNNAGSGSLANGVTDRPVVADPDLTEVNQVWLGYDFSGRVVLKVGRLGRNLGDQRFVGTVGWRQNHQSFDALQLELGAEALEAWKAVYLYLDQIHTVTGARQEISGHLLDLRYEMDLGSAGLSSQVLDYDAEPLWGRSTATHGLSFVGSKEFDSGLRWVYDVGVAWQTDHGDNPDDLSHAFRRLEWGIGWQGWTLRMGEEVLEGDGTTAFQTPLATLHKFNGWADRFLTTPADGLEDRYLKVLFRRGSWRAQVAYHEFDAENVSVELGSELDAQLLWDAPWKQQFGLKLADYDAERHSADVFKAMLWTSVSF